MNATTVAGSRSAAKRAAPGSVAILPLPGADREGHDYVSLAFVARRLAALKHFTFTGEVEHADVAVRNRYLVPAETLVGLDRAAALGIRTENDLFGGVVPWPYVATKVITHPLVDGDAAAPPHWVPDFIERAEGVVIPGFSVFSTADAKRAGKGLLVLGDVRWKRPAGKGGHGQGVVRNEAQLEAMVAAIPDDCLMREGLVLEQNLLDVETVSVGQVRIGRAVLSYWGTQQATKNHAGNEAYGGSRLHVVRGGFDELLAEPLGKSQQVAVEQARQYDAAAARCFPGFVASRRNYDVVQGHDAQGAWRSGVLEQSWRAGGASSAEIAALEAFATDSTLTRVTTRSVELFDVEAEPPRGATVYYRGQDKHAGMIMKYVIVERDVDAG